MKEYITFNILVVVLFVLIPLGFYFLAKQIRSKYNGKVSFYFKGLIASIFCFAFYMVYLILLVYFDIELMVFGVLYFVHVPISILGLIIFSVLFFTKRTTFSD